MKRKNLFIVALAAVFLASPPMADAQQRLMLKNAASYANSQIDTITITNQTYTAANNIWIRGVWRDTAAVDITFWGRIEGDAAWTAITAATDSVIYANSGSIYDGWTLRGPTIDRYPGLNVDIQIRFAYRSSGKGFLVDTNYDLEWWIRN